MDYKKEALEIHAKNKGKIEIKSKVPLKTNKDLALAYTPGVAEVCLAISKDRSKAYQYTQRSNMIAVVSDGSRVLGLGNIGPEAALPVMEGKAILFKEFGDVDAFPICLNTQDPEEIITAVKNIAPNFGGINLEDIASPKCFEIEERLKQELDIPVFHDDQHGTAIAVLAGLINALKVANKKLETAKIVITGAGAAGSSIIKILKDAKASNIIAFDADGVIHKQRENMDKQITKLAEITNPNGFSGNLEQAMESADIFIGVSAPNIVSEKMVASMNENSIVFSLANPIPEITPEKAKKGGARIIATGRSDYPNQINNLLCFPGIFRGMLDTGLPEITQEIKIAAAYAIAELVTEEELGPDCIIPSVFNKKVAQSIAKTIQGFK